MRRLDELILSVRYLTDNVQVSVSEGIGDDSIVHPINEGLEELTALIDSTCAGNLTTETTISLVANQESYDLPTDILSGRRVQTVEFSRDGQLKNYIPLSYSDIRKRDTFTSEWPSCYFVRQDKLYINPIPTSAAGTLRVTYQKRLPSLDVRRGHITVINDDGTNYTTFTLDNVDPDPDDMGIMHASAITVVDSLGVIQHANMKLLSYDQGTRVGTFENSPAIADGTVSVGDYICLGELATTHTPPEITRMGERYLVAYAVYEVFKQDDLVDESSAAMKLQRLESRLVEQLRKPLLEEGVLPPDWYEI